METMEDTNTPITFSDTEKMVIDFALAYLPDGMLSADGLAIKDTILAKIYPEQDSFSEGARY